MDSTARRRVGRVRTAVVALGVGGSLALGTTFGLTALSQSGIIATPSTTSTVANGSTTVQVGTGSTVSHATSSGS